MEERLVSWRIVIDNQLESDSRESDTCASEMRRTGAVSKRQIAVCCVYRPQSTMVCSTMVAPQLAVSGGWGGGRGGSLVKELCVPNRFLEYNYRIIRFRFRIPHFVLSRGLGTRDVVPLPPPPPPPPFVFKHHRLLRSGQITYPKRNERRDENRTPLHSR